MRQRVAILTGLAMVLASGCTGPEFRRQAGGEAVRVFGIAQTVNVWQTHTGDATSQADKPITTELGRELGKGADVTLPVGGL